MSHKHSTPQSKKRFTAANFVRWEPKQATSALFFAKDFSIRQVAAPIYTESKHLGPCEQAVYTARRWPSALGLLSARDFRKTCQRPAIFHLAKWKMATYDTGLAYNNLTPVEIVEQASGATWLRVKTPRKALALNDVDRNKLKPANSTDNAGEQADAMSDSQRKREKNLKRYQVGEKMISNGLSADGYRKLKLFGSAIQNQATKANPAIFTKKFSYASHLTLTLPGTYPTIQREQTKLDKETGELITTYEQPDYSVIKKWFTAFIDNFSYHVQKEGGKNAPLYYGWVIEEQERGAPHYHILFAHFMPIEAVKKLWSRQIDKWRAANGLQPLTPNEQDASVTIRAVRSFSTYLVKYFAKQDMQIPGQCWGLSHAANALCEPNRELPVIYFESRDHALGMIAYVANKVHRMKNAAGGAIAALHSNLARGEHGFLPYLADRVKSYKPPAVWCSNPIAMIQAWQHHLSSRIQLPPEWLKWPQSAIKRGRDAVPLYQWYEKTELAIT